MGDEEKIDEEYRIVGELIRLGKLYKIEMMKRAQDQQKRKPNADGGC